MSRSAVNRLLIGIGAAALALLFMFVIASVC